MRVERILKPSPALLRRIASLRHHVWNEVEGRSEPEAEGYLDDFDRHPTTVHYLVWEGERIAASARLSFHGDLAEIPWPESFAPHLNGGTIGRKIASLNRLVVSPGARGRGIAAALDGIRVDDALTRGASTLLATPVGRGRTGSLAALGFRELGVWRELPGMPESKRRTIYLMARFQE